MKLKLNYVIPLSLLTIAAFGQSPKKFDPGQAMLEKNCAVILKELTRMPQDSDLENMPLHIQIDVDVCGEIWRRNRRDYMRRFEVLGYTYGRKTVQP